VTKRILFVDDEFNVLAAIKRQLQKRFEIEIAKGSQDALSRLKDAQRYAVVVSDLKMPGVDGISLLARVRAIAPDVVRIILTGQVEVQAALSAINEAGVFRFLTKPCDADVLGKALDAALEVHGTTASARETAAQTAPEGVALFTEILQLVNRPALAKGERLRAYARHIGRALGLEGGTVYEAAALLSHLGCVAVRPETVEKLEAAQPVTPEEYVAFQGHPEVGGRLLAHLPLLAPLAAIVAAQRSFAHPVGPTGDIVTIGSQLLRVVTAFDSMLVSGMPTAEIFERLALDPAAYPPVMVDALARLNADTPSVGWVIGVGDIKPGMIFAEEVRSRSGALLASRTQEATALIIARIVEFAHDEGVVEPIRVRVPMGHAGLHGRAGAPGQGA
jgi:response regulator RpfG family c-di-GMP phosphodiesterase